MWVVSSQFWVTTLWVKHAGAATQAMADADQAVIQTWATNVWKPQAETFYALRQVKSYNFGTTPPTPFTHLNLYPLSTITGNGVAGSNLPPWTTLAISLRTGLTTDIPKPPSGRIYHVGGLKIGSMNADSTAVDGATQTAKANVWNSLNGAFTNVGNIGDWVVMSWYLGGSRAAPVFRATPLALSIRECKTDTRIDAVRRRMPRQQSYTTN